MYSHFSPFQQYQLGAHQRARTQTCSSTTFNFSRPYLPNSGPQQRFTDSADSPEDAGEQHIPAPCSFSHHSLMPSKRSQRRKDDSRDVPVNLQTFCWIILKYLCGSFSLGSEHQTFHGPALPILPLPRLSKLYQFLQTGSSLTFIYAMGRSTTLPWPSVS